jgi:hypothetical protein
MAPDGPTPPDTVSTEGEPAPGILFPFPPVVGRGRAGTDWANPWPDGSEVVVRFRNREHGGVAGSDVPISIKKRDTGKTGENRNQ